MALKITTQIGTDKGITSEAYVRIWNYQLNKSGTANFQVETFQSEDDAIEQANNMVGLLSLKASNQQIGENLFVALTAQVEEEISYPVSGVDADGNPLPDRVETITKTVPDLSSAEGVDIFAFGYSHLKAKLVGLFGEDNVADC